MPSYTAPDQLQVIDPAHLLIGKYVLQADVQSLLRQHNTCVGGAGSPWVCAQIGRLSGVSTPQAILKLPPMPGVRKVGLGFYAYFAAVGEYPTISLDDDTGNLGSYTLASGNTPVFTSVEWTREQDGWILVTVSWPAATGARPCSLVIAPLPPDASTAGQEADLYAHDDRVIANAGLSVRCMDLFAQGVLRAYQRPQVFYTYIDVESWRATAGATEYIIKSVPILSRGRALGMSVEGTAEAAAEVILEVGGKTLTCTGWAGPGATIVDSGSSGTIKAGAHTGGIKVSAPPASAFQISSISIYEYPV